MIPHRASSSFGYLALGVLATGLWVEGSARAQSACRQLGADCTHPMGNNSPRGGEHVPTGREIHQKEEKEKRERYDATMQQAFGALKDHNYQQAFQLYLDAQALYNTKQVRSMLAKVQGENALTHGDKRTALAYYEESIKACRRCWKDKNLIPNLKQQLADEDREDRAARETLALQQVEAASGTSSAGATAARTYRPSGNALIGGTTWNVAYNVQNANPKLVAKAREMMAQQMKLAGIPYSDGVDFNRYNFVLGIADSTNKWVDLRSRVIFDEFKNGKFSAKEQNTYALLKDRQFNELACHSNGAMICLAALENKDVIADHVVLYGPQVTLESLGMWDELVRSGRVKSVQIYINQSDPVPAFSLLIGDGALHAIVLRSMAMFMPPSIARVFGEASPLLTVQTLPCGNGRPTLCCHDMKIYKEGINYKPELSQQKVPCK
jgi:hypothetical protein